MMLFRDITSCLFCDEWVGDTVNVNPDIKYKGFEYNSTCDTCDEYPFVERRGLLLVPTKPSIPKSINEWMVGSQTDITKPWYAAPHLVFPSYFGSQTNVSPTIANNFTEVSPEITELSESNSLFNDVLIIALSEISFLLDRGMDKLNYQIKVKIAEDLEFPEWKETLISIKVPKRSPEELIHLWKLVEERVRKKIESIKNENEEEINKINENLVIVIE